MSLRRVAVALVLSLSVAAAAFGSAAVFTPGNLVVYRVGTGTGSLVNTGNPVFLDEYTPAGVYVQSVTLPTATAASNKPLIASGTASSEGLLTRSSDGGWLVLTGYGTTTGGAANLTTSTSSTIPRVVGLVGGNATINTSTALTDAASGSNIRGAASTNGTDLWVTGGAGGVRYTTTGASTSTQVSTTLTNLRAVHIFDGQLYISTSSGSAVRVGAVGSGLPTSTGSTITNLSGFPTSGSPYGFFFADLDASVAGYDTLYVADDAAGLQKYSLVAGSWALKGTITAAGIRSVTGLITGTSVALYGVTGASTATGGGTLYAVTDTSGYNAAPSTTSATSLVTLGSSNKAFRGIAFAPVGPSVTSITPAATSTNASSTTFTVVFSQSVTGVDKTDFTVSTVSGTAAGAASAVSGTGTTYTVTVDLTGGDGTVRLDLNGSGTSIVNGSGTDLSAGFASGDTCTIDRTAPTVLSVDVPAAATYVAGQSLVFTVNFSEAVSVDTTGGTPQLGLTFNSGSASAAYVSGSGTTALTFSYTVAAGNSDPDGITVAALSLNGGTMKDAAGNAANLTLNSVALTNAVRIDAVPPAVTAVSVPSDGTYVAAQNLDFTAAFGEAVFVTGTPRLPVTLNTGGTVYASYLSGSGSSALVFRYAVAAGNADNDGITVGSALDANGGTIVDAAGNNAVLTLNSVGSTAAVLIDAIAPVVSSINRAAATPTNATSIPFTVTFAENVTGVDTTDFTLTVTSTAAGTVASVVAVDASTYTVTVSPVSGDGTLRLDLKSSGTGIADTATNAIATGFTTGQSYSIDQTSPVVTSVTVPADGTYAAGQNLDFAVTFGEAVTVDTTGGTPRIAITLNTGGTVYASYVSGSGSTVLLFRYTVSAGNADPDGITVGALGANGGTIRDGAGNDAVLTLNGVGSTALVKVDATAPAVSSVVRTAGGLTSAASVTFTATFSAAVTGVDATDFQLATTGTIATASITGVTGSGTTYTITVNTGTGDGTIALDVLNDGTIKNASNTPLGSGFTGGEAYTIDRTAPSVSSVTPLDPATTNLSSLRFSVTFSESVSGVDAADFTLTTTGITGASVTGVSFTGTSYTVTVNSGTGDGTIRLDVAANGTVIDGASNALASAFNTGAAYTIDKTAPTIASVTRLDSTTTNAGSVRFSVAFSESVTGVNVPDFTLTTTGTVAPTISSVTGSGTAYTVTVNTGTGDGTIRLDVAADGTIVDGAGNALASAFTTAPVYTVDKSVPTVTIAPAGTTPSSAATVDFTITFSESVSGVDATVFTLNAASAITGASITGVTGSGATYTASVATGSGNGTLGLDLSNGAAVTDAAGNAAANTTGQTYTMQGTPAAPSGVSATAGNAKVTLSWSAATYATSYAVKRATVSGGPFTAINSSVTATTYDDTTAVNGTAYFYVVSATGARGTSADSSQVTATPSAAPAGPTGVVISQVYGGGGSSSGTPAYTTDYVEIFNRGTGTVDLTGWSIQYGSSTNNFSGVFAFPASTTIAGGKYLSVKLGTTGTAGAPLTTDFANTSINMAAASGKVALAKIATALGCGATATPCSLPDTRIADFVSYGAANNAEGGVSVNNGVALDSTKGAVRNSNGCTDTDNNNADFTVATPATGLVPRTASSPGNSCGGPVTNDPPVITAPSNPAATVLQDAAPFTVNVSGTDDGNIFNWTAAAGTGIASVAVTAGQGTATATYTVTLTSGFNGTANFTASLSDNVNPAVTQLVTIAVTATGVVPATPSGVTATAANGHVVLNWTASSAAAGYKVKRSTTSGSGYTTLATPTGTSYDDTAVANGTTYYYVVSATNATGESANSTEVSATPNYIDVVISQVYGGGGSGTPAYANDYIELFNRGANAVDISGYSIQYGSATGTFGSSGTGFANLYVFPAATTIGAGKYLTIKTGPAATSGATFSYDLQTPTTDMNMSGSSGKVALASTSTSLGCGATATPCALPDSRILDLVAYGAANDAEGGAAVTNGGANLDATMGAVRRSNGCTDTDNNGADFTTETIASGGLVPRTLAAPANVCGPINHAPSIAAPLNPAATVVQNAAPFTIALTGFDDGGVYSWSATSGNGVASVVVSAGQSTGSVTYTVTLQSGFYGTASFTASLTDGVNPAATRVVTVQVNPDPAIDNPPLITPTADPIASVAQDSTPFNVNVTGNDDKGIYNWSATPGTGISSVAVTAGAGTQTATFTVTLQAGFNGTATFTASLSDGVNAAATRNVNVTVRSANHLVISQLYGGGGNSGATYRNDYVELYNPTTTTFDLTGWTLQYASATATTFTNIQPIGGTMAPGQTFFISLASGGAEGADLPPANVYGDLNFSATAGKVALVRNGDGATGCADVDIVDLVGYGTTASCSEGNANAPAPSNTTALFRRNGGRTDTDNNLNDFFTGTPAPVSGTAPIVELGPSIVSTDPVKSGTNAPRDANIAVNFSEPVDVTTGWITINCATSGAHIDATYARSSSRNWVVIPNANFTAGETCTATVLKDFVHDSDLNDSAPNTDTLLADYSWTFTVSTGTAPPYAPDVHLTMGNPSGAVADVSVPNNYLMEKPEFALSYNRDRGTPNWVSWHLSDEWVGSLARVDTFRADPAVPPQWYRVLSTDYSGSGFDRGHMTPNADRDKETSTPINQATFLMSNMVPQSPDNNQGPWANFENYLRGLLPANELYIVAGPAGVGGTGSNGPATTVANGHVTVPASTWKVVLVLPKATGDDVARVTAATRTIAINIPNVQGIRTNNSSDWQTYLTTVSAIESLTGYDFFPNVPRAIQAAIQAGVNGVNPPGAATLSISAMEDASKAITLEGASPVGGALTYTVLTQPSHGTLSGAAASWTYTPTANYNGADSFTYRVNDGTGDSPAGTVNIAVAEVNDPPSATNDVKSTPQNTVLRFPAADLTANDSAGPSNESGQTLTVTAVGTTAQTHGTVGVSGGQVTYTPDATWSGPATFTYTMCDNGLTNGVPAALCATATVTVNVSTCTAPITAAPVVSPASVCPLTPNNVASAPAGAVSYAWQITNGTITAGAGTSSITFTAGTSGTVSFTVSMTMPSGCPAQSSGSTRIGGPVAMMDAQIHACPGSTVPVRVLLDGRAPFELVWSDGLRQSGITESTVVRQIAVTGPMMISVVEVSDASCATTSTASTEILVDGPPRFAPLPVNLTTWPGQPVMITVTAAYATKFTWFEGAVGDESKPLGNGPTYTTPPLHGSMAYWVRADSPCGSTRSGAIVVTVLASKRRPSSH